MSTSRYDSQHLPEAQFEPGSRGRVLKNLHGIRGRREMDSPEALKPADAEGDGGSMRYQRRYLPLAPAMAGRCIAVGGKYRQLNVSKGGFAFAMAAQIPRLMQDFGREIFGQVVEAGDRRVLAALLLATWESALSAAFFTPSIAIEDNTFARKARSYSCESRKWGLLRSSDCEVMQTFQVT